MTYATNHLKAVAEETTFVILSPRRVVTGFTLFDTDVWVADFEYGYLVGMVVSGSTLTPVSSSALAVGEFFYDQFEKKVYIFSGVDPATLTPVATYEIYFSNYSCVHNRNPLDANSEEIEFEGGVVTDPSWFQQTSDVLFGFFPLQSSGLSISNAKDELTKHLYDSSWWRSSAFVFHCIGDITVANTKLIFSGYTSGFRAQDSTVSFDLESIFMILDQEYLDTKYVLASDFANAEPNSVSPGEEWPIRRIFGVVKGFVPINIQHGAASTVNNRSWITQSSDYGTANVTQLINTGGTNNTTTTTVTSADGFMVGDQVRIFHSVGLSYSVTITAINYGTGVLTHSVIGARTVTAGDNVTRTHVGSVKIRDRNNVIWELLPNIHWNAQSFVSSTNAIGFTLVNDFEALIGGFPSPFDPDQDQIFCTVYGTTEIDDYVVAGTPVTTDNQRGGNLNNIAAIIYKFLREIGSIYSIFMDEDSFQDVIAENTDIIGYMVPAAKTQHDYPTYKEIITDLLRTGLMRLQINDFTDRASIGISLLKPLETPDNVVTAYDFNGLQIKSDYSDVYSDVQVRYQIGDVTTSPFDQRPVYLTAESTTNDVTVFLHGIVRTLLITTFLTDTPEAATYAKRVGYAVSDRKQSISLTGRRSFILAELGETYQLDREQLPGYDRIEGTLRTRNYVLAESDKSTTDVTIRLEDQKGVEDNSGDW